MRLTIAVAVTCLSIVGIATADPALAAIRKYTDIPAQALGSALQALAKQRDFQIVCRADLVADLYSHEISGELTPGEALAQLLNGTNMTYRYLDDKTLTIVPLPTHPSSSRQGVPVGEQSPSGVTSDGGSVGKSTQNSRGVEGRSHQSSKSFWRKFRLAQAENSSYSGGEKQTSEKSSENSQERSELGEVIVTAQKREQHLMDVPLSLSTLSGDDISRRGLAGMGDYLNSVPGVTMLDKGVARNAIIFRGISTDPEFEGLFTGSPAVGIYFGDVPLTVTTLEDSADVKLVDMRRVEVLRGPQGTLYGSGSLSGTVRNIPNAPNLEEFEGKVRGSYSLTERASHGNYMVQGIVNIPILKDQVAIRAVGYRYENGGFVDNVAGDDPRTTALAAAAGLPEIAVNEKDVGDDQYTGGRFSILWKPTEHLDAQFSYLRQELEQDGFPEVELTRADDFEQTRFDISGFVSGGERLKDELDISNLVLSYTFPWGTFHSSSSWASLTSVDNHDVRQLFTPGTLLGDLPLPQAGGQGTDAFSGEVRFVSDFDGPIQLIAGLYYENVDQSRFANTFWGFGDPALNPFGDPALLLFRLDTDLEQVAFFGEASYDWRDLVTVTFGARVFDYERDDVDSRAGTFGTGTTTPLAIEEQDESFKASVSYTPTESIHGYFQWAEGFRLGRGNLPIPAAVCDVDGDGFIDGTSLTLEQVKSLKSDTLENFELGGKFLWLDKRLTTNLAFYHVNWDEVPLSIVPPCGFGVTPNAGKARVRGIEFDGSLSLTDALRMNIATSFKDGELRSVVQGVPAQPGDRLPGSADFNFSAGLQYDFPLAGRDAFLRGEYNYVGGYYNNLQETGLETGDYHLGNIRFGVSTKQLDLEVFVNNVTDAGGLTWTSLAFFADQRGVRLRPRTVGVEMQVNF